MKTLEAGKQFCLNPGVIGRRFVGLVFAQLRLSKCFFCQMDGLNQSFLTYCTNLDGRAAVVALR